MVFDYMPITLSALVKKLGGRHPNYLDIKLYTWQLFNGLMFLFHVSFPLSFINVSLPLSYIYIYTIYIYIYIYSVTVYIYIYSHTRTLAAVMLVCFGTKN
uniref:Protein kinase domain-containing protein n=1 Tax=Parascaris univalens TaxID=6257 RepID=A0A915A6N8_PARUN